MDTKLNATTIFSMSAAASTQSLVRDILLGDISLRSIIEQCDIYSNFSPSFEEDLRLNFSCNAQKDNKLPQMQRRFAIYTLNQTAGYGQYSRQWESPQGNIATTIAVPLLEFSGNSWDSDHLNSSKSDFIEDGFASHDLKLDRVANLQFKFAIIVRDFLQKYIDDLSNNELSSRLVHKPINDILMDDGKIAGVLSQIIKSADGSLWVLIGIGINMISAPKIKISSNCLYNRAVSIADILSSKGDNGKKTDIAIQSVHKAAQDLIHFVLTSIDCKN